MIVTASDFIIFDTTRTGGLRSLNESRVINFADQCHYMNNVFHRTLPTDLTVMPFLLRMMKIVGLWGNEEHLYLFVFGCFWIVSIILFPKAVLGIGSDRFDAIAKGWSEFIFEGNMLVSMVILSTKKDRFNELINLLIAIIKHVTHEGHPKKCIEEIRKQNSTIDKFSKFYAIYCAFGPFVFCVPSLITSYMRYYDISGNNSTEMRFELPMEQRFYGMRIRTNFVHYNIFVVLSLSSYCFCAFFFLIKVGTMIAMMKYCALVFRLISIEIQELNHISEHIVKVRKISRIVRLHNRAYDVTQLVEDIMNIPLMMQLISCMMFWCLTLFYASTNFNISLLNVMVLFFLSLVETYGYCYVGTKVTSEAAAVGEAIYELPWYKESVELQNRYRFTLHRSQSRTGITAANFFIVGHEQFGKITQMSYSFYLVLKNTLPAL
ncbi:odorant receptor 45b-like [Toxorhynchites rutilus septentrionalis]|uniref:odorant receptor 45b-like n=1 Tax=Toxorhynchites rutilus septentrionalis TaxID=329112 RepID=UPI00247A01AC|nr:odorant receptor 45b-like [Toxorhynchites rutilus septentrionalis]